MAGSNSHMLLSKEFKDSLLNHAVASGRDANCFFQTFIHTLSNQSEETLKAIEENYKSTVEALVDSFNDQFSLSPPLKFRDIIEVSKSLHPLERECVFGPILRDTFNAMIERGIITGSNKLKHNPHAIVHHHQTSLFANAFGANLTIYMNHDQFGLAVKVGMPREIVDEVKKTRFEVGNNALYYDRPRDQKLTNGKLFELNLIWGDSHFNYTLGNTKLNNDHRQQIITTTTENGGIYATGPAPGTHAPLARPGLDLTIIKSELTERIHGVSISDKDMAKSSFGLRSNVGQAWVKARSTHDRKQNSTLDHDTKSPFPKRIIHR